MLSLYIMGVRITYICKRNKHVKTNNAEYDRIEPILNKFWILYPASILHKSIAGRYRPVSYPDGPIAARYIFM